MTKADKIKEITADMGECLVFAERVRDKYEAVLNKLRASDDIASSDLPPFEAGLFQALICADMIAMKAVQLKTPMEFLQHMVDQFEVYELAYKIGRESQARVAEVRERTEVPKIKDDDWDLGEFTIH